MNEKREVAGEPVIIPEHDSVKVTVMNHLIEVQHMEKMNTVNHIKKLDKDRYLDLRTGEIKDFQHSENRQQNYNSLRQTFKKLRYLINNNFTGKPNEIHLILTYAENMTDPKQLYKDFDKFMKRLRYKYENESSIDYLSVIEPQGRGAWHCHVLMRFNDLEKVYIPNKFDKSTKEAIDAPMYDLWGNGWITIKSLKDVDNIGAYLSAYLTDIEFDATKFETGEYDWTKFIGKDFEVKSVIHEGQEKKFIKGGRLYMYPPGMNLYRKSKGIDYPEHQMIKYKNIKKIVGSAEPNYSKSYHIENGDFENTITFVQYNLKR